MPQKVVIIGAGPAGLLLAHYLLRRDEYFIDIYERRPDPRQVDVSQDRTFPISLQERGRKALRVIPGLEEAIAAQGVFCQGTIVYRNKGKARRIPRKNSILSIDRNRLVTVLLQQLMEQDSADQVKVHFGYTCIQVDGKAKTVTLQPEQGDTVTVAYDVLVGADGARSQVRNYLVQQGSLQCDQHYISDAYKSVFLQRRTATLEMEPDKIHTWNLNNQTRMILVPQPNDRLNGVIIFDAKQNPIEGLSTPEEVLAFFQQNFPLFGQLMSLEEAEAFLNRPVARVVTVRCDRFHDDNSVVVLGDAAHAVSPSIGQGCNASLEDVLILERLLETNADDWGKALPEFSQQRLPDAHALQELSTYSFPRNSLLVFEFFLRLTLGRRLHQWFPQRVNPFVFDLVLDTDLPYSQVLHLCQGWINKVKRSTPKPDELTAL
jgi:kynurenine 3-monooxygenase